MPEVSLAGVSIGSFPIFNNEENIAQKTFSDLSETI